MKDTSRGNCFVSRLYLGSCSEIVFLSDTVKAQVLANLIGKVKFYTSIGSRHVPALILGD